MTNKMKQKPKGKVFLKTTLGKVPDNKLFRISESSTAVDYRVQRKNVLPSYNTVSKKAKDHTHAVVTSERSSKTFIWPMSKVVLIEII